jgi:EpsI family protein
MDSSKRFTLAAAGMVFTAAAAAVLKPEPTKPQSIDNFDLQLSIPKTFGTWLHQPTMNVTIVDPQTKELLDKIYSQILTRVYRDKDGYSVMLSIAYGSDQRGALQSHKPEVCYPAQGFSMIAQADASIRTPDGAIPVRQLQMALGARKEPLTYWFTVGAQSVVTALDRRVAMIKSVMTGRIPDGLLFRVSSIDPEPQNAFKRQSNFVLELLSAMPASTRTRFSGLS